MLSYYSQKKQELFDLLGGKCVQCGALNNLEFDHINWRTKEFTIGNAWGIKDKEKLRRELNKCQLLCRSCHKVKTAQDQKEQKLMPVNHGTQYAWAKRKCKCSICLEARKEWYTKRNAKRRTSGGPRGPYGLPAEHGTYKSYKRGCKCDLCKAANAKRAKEHRLAKEL